MEIKIQSYSDIITNSSSELFVLNNDLEVNFIEELLSDLLNVHNKLKSENFSLYDILDINRDEHNIIIKSAYDNSIPTTLSEFIRYELDGSYHFCG